MWKITTYLIRRGGKILYRSSTETPSNSDSLSRSEGGPTNADKSSSWEIPSLEAASEKSGCWFRNKVYCLV